MNLKELRKKMNRSDFTPLISLHRNIGVKSVPYVKPWKPKFTPAEKAELAELERAEKRAKVKELYAKYVAEKAV